MKKDSKRSHVNYFNSTWIPFCVYMAALLLSFITAVLPSFILYLIFLILKPIFFFGIILASIWNFIRKRWKKGVLNLGFALLSLIITLFSLGLPVVSSLISHIEFELADNISIPDNIEIAETNNWNDEILSGVEDGFQKSLMAELKTPDSGIPSVTAQISSLMKLQKNTPDILKRYLASSFSWRVFKERGDLYATRRLKKDSHWRCTLHGYYTLYDDNLWPHSYIHCFQTRLSIGFSGKPLGSDSHTTHLKEGQTGNLILSQEDNLILSDDRRYESKCVISADEIFVEVFEKSKAKERKLTKAALDYLEKELNPLSESPSWDTIQNILPLSSIRQGNPSFHIWGSGGTYDSQIWINPKEKGMIYLKAYEVTHNIRLSAERLKERSNEWIGWSDNPNELFFSNTSFTIYEGDWGKPYAARFEVWFVPDSGAPERKLMEKVFKIEGWER